MITIKKVLQSKRRQVRKTRSLDFENVAVPTCSCIIESKKRIWLSHRRLICFMKNLISKMTQAFISRLLE